MALGPGGAQELTSWGSAVQRRHRCPCGHPSASPLLPQMERVRQWEARLLWNIEEATRHELTVEDDD